MTNDLGEFAYLTINSLCPYLQTWTLLSLSYVLNQPKIPHSNPPPTQSKVLNIDLPQSPCQKFKKKITHSRYILIRQVLAKADTQTIKCDEAIIYYINVINVIDYCFIKNFETTVVSLDTEKAFDLENWKFLLAVLHKIGFGAFLINWIKTLYIFPNTCLRTNDLTPQGLNLKRGTRHGYLLSILLFVIFIEPLATEFRQKVGN